jgi:hypothetical protein
VREVVDSEEVAVRKRAGGAGVGMAGVTHSGQSCLSQAITFYVSHKL